MKQKVVSRSSVKSKYQALASLTTKILRVQSLLKEHCIAQTTTTLIWCDNESEIALTTNLIFHEYSKHIEIDLHFMCDKVLQRGLHIQYIPFTEQLVDIFTKNFPSSQFSSLDTQLFVVLCLASL